MSSPSDSCRRRRSDHLPQSINDELHNSDEERIIQINSPLIDTERDKDRRHSENDDDSIANSSSSSSPSSSSVSTTASQKEIGKKNVNWSMISNIFFIVGSILFLVLAIWDLRYENEDDDDDYDDDYDDDDYDDDAYDDDDEEYWFQDTYTIISLIACILLIMNAAIDLFRAYIFSKQQQEHDHAHTHILKGNPKWDAYAALAFGFAAIIDLINVFVGYYETNLKLGIYLEMASAHLYLLNAILALSGNNVDSTSILSYCCCSFPNAPPSTRISCKYFINNKYGPSFLLEKCGDILFFVGSFIDVIISYISDPQLSSASALHTIGVWSAASSALWVLDALLYIVSDILLMSLHYDCSCCNKKRRRRRKRVDWCCCSSCYSKCSKNGLEMQGHHYGLLAEDGRGGEEENVPSDVLITPSTTMIT